MPISALMIVAVGICCLGVGFLATEFISRRRLREAVERYEALRRDFEIVSAVNIRLLNLSGAPSPASNDEAIEERFFALYDEAKRCLHRALDQHNATAVCPLVISRDGSNLLRVLGDLPRGSFSDDSGEDAGVRAWLRRVFELEAERRANREGSRPEALLALERERELWRTPLLKRA